MIEITMHKVFMSYHHRNDQSYKEQMVDLGARHSIFVDRSVDTGDIPDEWADERIRSVIRDRYLRDSTVTIVLIGSETRRRKHVDWEIYSSMYDGPVNKNSGLIVSTFRESRIINAMRPMEMKRKNCCIRKFLHGPMSRTGRSSCVDIPACLIESSTTWYNRTSRYPSLLGEKSMRERLDS